MNLQEQISRIQSMMGVINESQENIYDAEYYLDDFYAIDFNDEMYDENDALKEIQKVIDYVLNLTYPIKVYRGINTIKPVENYGGYSWSTDKRVAESFGNKIFVGYIPNQNVIDVEQTIRTRVMNPYEYEIAIPNHSDIIIEDIYTI